MVEIWKDITEYKGVYQVSDAGNARSLDRTLLDGRHVSGKQLVLVKNSSGYYQVGLSFNGVTRKYYIHRLVYSTFVGEIVDGNDINHIDHDKGNNTPSNLESITHQANAKDQAIFANGVYKDSHDYEHSHRCPMCGGIIRYTSSVCVDCVNKSKTSYRIPKDIILESLTRNNGNFTQAAKEFGMSDNSLRKWCKKYGLPSKSSLW